MAENGVITIKFVEGSDKTPGPKPIQSEGSSPEVSSSTTGATDGGTVFNTAMAIFAAKRVANDIKQVGIGEVKYQMNLYFEMNDNYLGQQNLNRALNVINKTKEYGKAMISYGALGAMVGGPIGAVLGVAVGAGIETLKTWQQTEHNKQQENINIARMDAQLQFNRQRAGYSLTAGSIGENK